MASEQPPSDCTTSNALAVQALMVLASAIMGLLAGLLLIFGLRGRLSGAATTNPTIRFFLWVVFALSLPLMSYMFSEAKAKNSPDVLREQQILLWMLLVELLHRRLGSISMIRSSPLQGINKQSTWDAIDKTVRIAWIAYLIYQYVHDSYKPILIVLWVFCVVKVVQMVAAAEVAKRSFALGRNPPLIADYMRQSVTAAAAEESTAMTACKYVIMGEDEVKKKLGPRGYRLELSDDKEKDKMVTVGDVWRLAENGDALFTSPKLKLKDLCFSFALYKLLRRRFEGYPSAEAGRHQSFDFLLHGLLDEKEEDSTPRDRRQTKECDGERVFRVIEDELSFLSDYYFSTIPVTLSNRWFFLLNYVVVQAILLLSWVMIFAITGNGDIVGKFDSIYDGFVDELNCLFHRHLNLAIASATSFDLIITVLIIATVYLLECAEGIVYVLSDWVMVSLLRSYAKKPSWQRSAKVHTALRMLRRAKNCLKHPEFEFNQHSVLEPRGRTLRIFSQLVLRRRFLKVQSMLLKLVLHRRFLGVRSTPVPKEVKTPIVKYLTGGEDRRPPNKGKSALRRNGALGEELGWACEGESAAETIIVWHIATCLYEMKHPPPQQSPQSNGDGMQANRKVAETLSKYCTYLVALAPELLPDDVEGTQSTYKEAVREIQNALLRGRDREDFDRVTKMAKKQGTVAEKGAELGRQLVAAKVDEAWVWKVLAEVWTEVVIYVAPSDDVKSHAQALAQGGEFITHIWALLTHGGILRWPTPNSDDPLHGEEPPV